MNNKKRIDEFKEIMEKNWILSPEQREENLIDFVEEMLEEQKKEFKETIKGILSEVGDFGKHCACKEALEEIEKL